MLKEFLFIAMTVFLMEIADKTQIATIGFAARHNPVMVYAASVLGLAACTVLSVLFGGVLAEVVPEKYLKLLVGVLLIAAGIWSILG